MINENIEHLMYQSGRVEIDNFDLMVQNFYEENNISYKVYGKPIIIGKYITCNNPEYIPMIILDVESSDGTLVDKGIIDATSYPNRIPEDFIIESLDELVISGKIKPQYVKFVMPIDDNNIYVTDYLYEYKLFDRRFVLYEIPYGINANLTYWLEVEPNQTFTKTLKRVK